MFGLDNILEVIGSDPLTRWLLAAMALRAAWSLVCWRRCKMARADSTDEALEVIEARRQALWRHNMRYLLIVVAGIALAVAGLFGLAQGGSDRPLALVMLVGGMYLFMTEPVRLQIQDAEDRVAASALRGDAEAHRFSQSMLRGSHLNLVMIEVGVVVALGLVMLALNGRMIMPAIMSY